MGFDASPSKVVWNAAFKFAAEVEERDSAALLPARVQA
jgi:hypothetical protein